MIIMRGFVAFQASPRLCEYLEEMSPTPGNARELLSHLLAGREVKSCFIMFQIGVLCPVHGYPELRERFSGECHRVLEC